LSSEVAARLQITDLFQVLATTVTIEQSIEAQSEIPEIEEVTEGIKDAVESAAPAVSAPAALPVSALFESVPPWRSDLRFSLPEDTFEQGTDSDGSSTSNCPTPPADLEPQVALSEVFAEQLIGLLKVTPPGSEADIGAVATGNSLAESPSPHGSPLNPVVEPNVDIGEATLLPQASDSSGSQNTVEPDDEDKSAPTELFLTV